MKLRQTLLYSSILLLISGLSLAAREGSILVLGDSLAAGYGIDPEQAFPALLEKRLRKDGYGYRVINAGVSGDTSAGGLRRVDWLLRRPVDLLILELGANDGLRGIPLESTKENLQGIIDKTREKNPSVRLVIAGMMVPPNLGQAYSRRFREIFVELAAENDAALIPFLLEGIAGDPDLNLPDGIHPTPEGHRRVARNVWEELEPMVRELASNR